MSCDDVLYILSYFEGRIDIYECIYFYKKFLIDDEDIMVLDKHINYLEGKVNSLNLDRDYMFEVEDYLLNIISRYLKDNNYNIDVDLNVQDIVDIKNTILRCRY